MNYQDSIEARRAERMAKQRKAAEGKVSTEFDDMIPAPGASYVINEAGDQMIVGRKYNAEEVAQRNEREELRKNLDILQHKADSIYKANDPKWREQTKADTYTGPSGMFGHSAMQETAVPEDKKKLEAIQTQISRARKALDTYTEQDQEKDIAERREKSWYKELWSGLSNTTAEEIIDIPTLGFTSVKNSVKINSALKKASEGKPLTDIEQLAVDAFLLTQNAEQEVEKQGGATVGASIGGGILPAVVFMAETAATGGSGGLIKTGVKAVVKQRVESGIKAAVTQFGKGLGKAAAFEAVRTPMRGSMYQNVADRVGDQYSEGENGEVVKDEVSPFTIFYKSYASTFAESLSEQVGNITGSNWLGKGIKAVVPKKLGRTFGGAIVDGVDKLAAHTKDFREFLQKTTNYNGMLDEYLEEQVSMFIEPILTGEPERIKEMLSGRTQLITFGTCAAISSVAHVASTPAIVDGEVRDGKLRKQANASVASIENKELRQGVFDALKKGQTIEQKADAISKLDYENITPKDAAAIADAFTFNVEREILKGAAQEMGVQNETTQKVAAVSTKFSLHQNKDTGLVHELVAADGQHYTLMAGSIEGKGADDMLFVQSVTTGEKLQMAASNFVGEQKISYDQVIGHLTNNLTEKITDETLQQEQSEVEEDAVEVGVNSVSYKTGEVVELADGSVAEFIDYGRDMKNAQVAVENPETGEVSAVTIARDQIIGLATVEQVNINEQPVQNSEVKPSAEVSQVSDQTIEIPRRSDGTPDYNEMDGEMFLDEFSKDFSREEALAEMAEFVAFNKQKIEKLRKNQSNDMNVRAENRRKIAILEARNSDFEEVLARNDFGQQVAEEEQLERPKYKTIAEELTAMNATDYLSVEDYVLRDLARGVKFRWADKGVSRGLATMLGYKGKEKERRTRIGIVGKEGRGVDEYSELIWSQIESLGVPHADVKDDMDVRDKVLDVLQRVYSRGQAMTELRKLHTEAPQSVDAQMEQEAEWREDDMMREKQIEDADYFASIEKPTIGEMVDRVDQLNKINGANVEVISKIEDLPEDLRSLVDGDGFENKGISYQGVAYVNAPYAENMADLENTYIHETVGHQLVDTKIPIDGRKKLIGAILNSRSLDQMIEQIPIFAEVGGYYQEGIIDEVNVAREYVAYLAQTHLTISDLSAKYQGQSFVFDIDGTVSEQNIIELLKQLSNGIQSVEIRTTRSDQQTKYDDIYGDWRTRNFKFRQTLGDVQHSENRTMGEGSQQGGESLMEGEYQSSIQSGGKEIWSQGERRVAPTDVEAIQRVAEGDGEQRATEVESTEDALRYAEVETKTDQIEKLRSAESVQITGEEIPYSNDLKEYRANALRYGKSIKGKYVNGDTGQTINLSNRGVEKLLSHDKQNVAHISSIAAIPQLIENAIFIKEVKSEKEPARFDEFRYYVSGLKIGTTNYTVKIVIGQKNGQRYYDHALTEIEKGELLSTIDALTIAFNADNSPNNESENNQLSEVKDKRLIAILQNNGKENIDELVADQFHFREAHSNQRQANNDLIGETLQKLAVEFGIESVSVDKKRDLPQSIRNRSIGVNFKGAYDPTTDKVYFVKDQIISPSDAVATFLHEVVAHKGIDGLLGKKRAREFYNSVFDSQDAATRKSLLARYEGDKTKAGDEFVARIAEGNITPGMMQRAIAAVRKFLREVLGLKVKISDGDIRYMLFRSKVNLQRSANMAQAMSAIEADRRVRRQVELSELRMRDRAPIEEVNDIFNRELDKLRQSKSSPNYTFQLGMPSDALLSGGMPNLPIELEADRLRKKSKQKEHPFDLATVENLPIAIANPIAVFDSKNSENRKVIFTEISDGKMNFVVVIETEATVQRGREVLTVNSIRSLYPKESGRVIRWINEGLTAWVDKTKAKKFIEQQSVEIAKSDDKDVTRLEKVSGIRRSNYAEATSPDGYDPARLNNSNERSDIRRSNYADATTHSSSPEEYGQSDGKELNDATNIVQNFENPKNELRFSEAEDGGDMAVIRVSGNKKSARSKGIQFQEALQDATIKVHLLQKQIKAKGGVIDYMTNPYEALNHADSRAQAASERYAKHYIDPIAEMIERWGKYDVSNYEEVSDYLSAKHSIERHDSGIKALNTEKGWTREETQKIVDEFEGKIVPEEVDELWTAIRCATTELLDISVRSGRMSLDDKRDIQSHNWQYYVPLRGKDFDFEQIEDIGDIFYIDRKNGGTGDSVGAGKKAKGRSSKAADPISMLLYMASSEIVRSEHNIAMRHLLRLVEKYPERSDLFSLKQEWYVKRDNGWAKVNEQPSSAEILASNKARRALRTEKDPKRRAELEAQITVLRKDRSADKTYRGGYDPKSREVVVYKDGVRNIITMSDIEVAQAMNYRTGSFQDALSQSWLLGRSTRIMAQLSTSKNPAFILPNFVRDIKNAAQYHFVDSDGNLMAFMGYALSSWKILDRNLRGKAQPLTMGEIGNLDMLKLSDRAALRQKYGKHRVNDTLYEMFVVNGGETGYVHIAEANETERKLRKEIQTRAGHNIARKGWKGVNNGLDYLANLSENAVRYATFVAQIDNGNSVFDAITYAKNITVNFNRKGRYTKGMNSAYMFCNASIQATVNQYSLLGNKQGKDSKTIAKQRVRFALAKTITLMMGAASSWMVSKALAGLGDDDEKYTISDWERLTNFLIPVAGKGYIKIPVAQSERPIYALGVMMADWMDGKVETGDMVGTFLSMFQNAYTPIGFDFNTDRDGVHALIKPVIPAAWKPITDVWYNQDFMGRQINKESYSSLTPDSELGRKDALGFLKSATKWLNEIGGGNEVTPAGTGRDGKKDARNFLDISPSTVEYIMKSYSGGIGRIVTDAAKLITSDQKEARHIPVANRFYGEFYEKTPSSEYWNIAEAIKSRYSNNRKVEAKGIKSTIHEDNFEQMAKTDAVWRERLRKTDKEIKRIKEQLEEMPESSEEFKAKEKQIKQAQWQFINDYNTQYENAQHN